MRPPPTRRRTECEQRSSNRRCTVLVSTVSGSAERSEDGRSKFTPRVPQAASPWVLNLKSAKPRG